MVLPNEEPKESRKPKKPAKLNKSQERSFASCRSRPRQRGSVSSIQTRRGSTSTRTCTWSASPLTATATQSGSSGRPTITADLQEIAAWLKKCRVKTIAMESTGIYWIPLFEFLESGRALEVRLVVEPGQLSRCGAAARRPTSSTRSGDPAAALLRPLACVKFRPPDSVLALRAYWRQRQMQVRVRFPAMSSTCRRP